MTTDINKYVKYAYSATGVNYMEKEKKEKILLSEDSVLTEMADPATSSLGYFYVDSSTGFKGAIFQESETNFSVDIVIGFAASSDDNPQSGVANFEILLSVIPQQFYYAFNLYMETVSYYTNLYPEKTINISFCGWSLGGALAELMGCITGLKTYTFGSPGMSEYISNPILKAQLEYYANQIGRCVGLTLVDRLDYVIRRFCKKQKTSRNRQKKL